MYYSQPEGRPLQADPSLVRGSNHWGAGARERIFGSKKSHDRKQDLRRFSKDWLLGHLAKKTLLQEAFHCTSYKVRGCPYEFAGWLAGWLKTTRETSSYSSGCGERLDQILERRPGAKDKRHQPEADHHNVFQHDRCAQLLS